MKRALGLILILLAISAEKSGLAEESRFSLLNFDAYGVLAFNDLPEHYMVSGGASYRALYLDLVPHLHIALENALEFAKGRNSDIIPIYVVRLGPQFELYTLDRRISLAPAAGLTSFYQADQLDLALDLALTARYELGQRFLLMDSFFIRYHASIGDNLTHFIELGAGIRF